MSYSNVVATLALFVALGGSSYAAIKISGKNVRNNSLTGRDIKKGSVAGSDIKNRSLTGVDVRDGSLLAGDFAPGQLPAAQAGPVGPTGAQGPKGDTGPAGSPDTAEQVRDKLSTVDGAGSGVDADLLDGISSSDLVQGAGQISRGSAFRLISEQNVPALTAGDLTVRMDCDVDNFVRLDLINNASNTTVWVDDGSTQRSTILVQNAVLSSRQELGIRGNGAGLLATFQGTDSDGRLIVFHAAAYRDEFSPTTKFCSALVTATVVD